MEHFNSEQTDSNDELSDVIHDNDNNSDECDDDGLAIEGKSEHGDDDCDNHVLTFESAVLQKKSWKHLAICRT